MKRILVTGANGLVGQTLIRKITLDGDSDYLATSASECKVRDISPGRFRIMDINREDRVREVIGSYHPDVIIHCAAMTQVDACENNPGLCDRVNIEGTRNIARAAESFGARFVFISTDFVFDGTGGPYLEEDQPNPVSFYGWSKLQGELITRSLKTPWVIVRTILVYGVVPAMNRINLVLWVKKSLEAGNPIQVVDDQFRMPTLADDLADGILRAARQGNSDIYHLSGPEMLSVYEIAIRTARFFSLDESLISPVSSRTLNQSGKRPPSTGFVLGKACSELNYSPKNLDKGLAVVRLLLENYS